jgi:hypothetical protein
MKNKQPYTQVYNSYTDSAGIVSIVVTIIPEVVSIPSSEWIRDNKKLWKEKK